ncbi:MAG: GTP-binding protein [Candidatus Heimdallarchaeum aukensis]|uniref:Elongation factor 2 n=1 Tax=Candidatus Heimdallarchaeum aukensis TaxID=2876573 RepID=A0A9Y1BJ94_9ARCH|nr:MAG: GTP-binding protein [Candidatus Heimdallarchaeum aukensis]
MSDYAATIVNHMKNKELIRNICIVSHVDHGKTTLSDYLLQAGGLISQSLAGSARVLDYLEEEQQRGITIKTANISFIYKHKETDYLINLVDTPGHVDFSGLVAQAIRLVDGVIIVVDAVEGVMAQTHSVIKQSIEEGLKPILFINKVDRLINELKLDEKTIESKLNTIIQFVNELILQYSYNNNIQRKVSFSDGTVIIGSALYGWALSKYSEQIPKFSTIISLHKENNVKKLKKENSLISALMPAIVNSIPSPLIAQKARITNIIESISNQDRTSIEKCDNNGNTIICIGKLLYDKNRGIIAIGRLFSGVLRKGSILINTRNKKEVRIHQVCLYKGPSLITVKEVEAGNIATLIGMKEIQVGDVLVEDLNIEQMIEFKQISYLQEPVITIRIEPKNISDIPKLQEELEILSLIKPNFSYIIDENTGEIKVYGIGELQLEIILKDIMKTGLQIELSNPEVALVEQIDKEIEHKSIDSLGKVELSIKCSPTTKAKISGDTVVFKDKKNNFLVVEDTSIKNEHIDLLIIGFKNAIKLGVKSSNPIRNLTVIIKKIDMLEQDAFRYEIIVPAVKKIIHEAISNSIFIYEPIYTITITTPLDYLGAVLSVFQKYGGEVEKTEQISSKMIIYGVITVRSSLSLANELRKASEGFAFWQLDVSGYRKIKE